VVKHEPRHRVEGSTAAMTVGEAPRAVLDAALAAANLVSDGSGRARGTRRLVERARGACRGACV